MKKAVTVIILILMLVTIILPQTGCSEEIEPVPSESNRWLELLSVLPENESTLKAAFLQDSTYLDEQKQQYPQVSDEYIVIRDHPLLSGSSPAAYSDEEWKETLGFVQADIDQRIYAGQPPLSYYEAVRGRFSKEDVDNAVRTGPMNEMLEIVTYQGQGFYSWGGDMEVNLTMRSGVRPLGRGHRLALVDDFIFWVLQTDFMQAMIDSYGDNIKSLAGNEDYRSLAGALEELDVCCAFFSAEPQSLGNVSEIYHEIIEDSSNEKQQLFVEEIERQPRLKPYQAMATGAGIDANGYYMVIVLLNPDEEVAHENANLLEQRINQSNIVMAWHSQSGDKWSDLIESIKIESKGRLTIARLYGGVAECWVNFSVQGMLGAYEPLLIHE